eukprot:NODE_16386_length_997_cov_4.675862.p5 GENE.NODE_16386_length_997_cov_4.675862~~NODE_16386_length_997_cov_4.675862.p5  ORF type:complete len:102 (+),score=55.29 NODE_16386_length_997_cov_4.675862:661-966(+)
MSISRIGSSGTAEVGSLAAFGCLDAVMSRLRLLQIAWLADQRLSSRTSMITKKKKKKKKKKKTHKITTKKKKNTTKKRKKKNKTTNKKKKKNNIHNNLYTS